MVLREASLAVRPGLGQSHDCQDEVFAARLPGEGHPAAEDEVWYLIGSIPAPAAKRKVESKYVVQLDWIWWSVVG
jgi:hypothetical protein